MEKEIFGRSRVPPVHGLAQNCGKVGFRAFVRAALGAAQDCGKVDFRAVASPARTLNPSHKTPLVRAALGAALNYGKGGFSGGRESRPYMVLPKNKNCGLVLKVDLLCGRLYLVI